MKETVKARQRWVLVAGRTEAALRSDGIGIDSNVEPAEGSVGDQPRQARGALRLVAVGLGFVERLFRALLSMLRTDDPEAKARGWRFRQSRTSCDSAESGASPSPTDGKNIRSVPLAEVNRRVCLGCGLALLLAALSAIQAQEFEGSVSGDGVSQAEQAACLLSWAHTVEMSNYAPLEDDHALESWHTSRDSGVPVSEWRGVVSDGRGQIIELDVSGADFRLMTPECFPATLRRLVLSECEMYLGIGLPLDQIEKLESLDLARNNPLSLAFFDSLFEDLNSQAKHLQYLDLSFTGLTGVIPPELREFTRLRELDLSNNPALEGPLPDELLSLNALEKLYIHGTKLCAQSDSAWQAWLPTIRFRGTNCAP